MTLKILFKFKGTRTRHSFMTRELKYHAAMEIEKKIVKQSWALVIGSFKINLFLFSTAFSSALNQFTIASSPRGLKLFKNFCFFFGMLARRPNHLHAKSNVFARFLFSCFFPSLMLRRRLKDCIR